MLSKGNKSFASKGGTMVIREPESQRLGRDSERLVELMEHEKRESTYLDQQIALLQEELSQVQSSKKSIFPSSSSEIKQKNRCLVLEKRIELELIHLNETKARGLSIRNEINSYRKEKTHYKRTLQNIKDDISKYSKETEDKRQEYTYGLELDNKYQKKLQNLRSKSMQDKNQYTEKVSQFSSFILEKIETRKLIHKQIEEGILGQIQRQSDSVEITKLQKKLVQRWGEKVKEKKKALDNYMKHLNVLGDTFEQIRLATGIHSVDEIVTAVIKSEEQNYEVYSYVNSLNTEIDALQATYAKTLEDIKKLESGDLDVSEDRRDTLIEISEKKNKKKQEYEALFQQVQQLLPIMKRIFECCLESPIPLPRPEKDLKDLDAIEYGEVAEFLGNVEDYIGYAIVFLKNVDGFDEKKREKTPFNMKELDVRDVLGDNEFDDCKVPLSVAEFKQRTLSILKDSSLGK